MAFKFEKLRVWQYSFDLAEKIVVVANDFPEKGRYNLNIPTKRCRWHRIKYCRGVDRLSGPRAKEIFKHGESVSI